MLYINYINKAEGKEEKRSVNVFEQIKHLSWHIMFNNSQLLLFSSNTWYVGRVRVCVKDV